MVVGNAREVLRRVMLFEERLIVIFMGWCVWQLAKERVRNLDLERSVLKMKDKDGHVRV